MCNCGKKRNPNISNQHPAAGHPHHPAANYPYSQRSTQAPISIYNTPVPPVTPQPYPNQQYPY